MRPTDWNARVSGVRKTKHEPPQASACTRGDHRPESGRRAVQGRLSRRLGERDDDVGGMPRTGPAGGVGEEPVGISVSMSYRAPRGIKGGGAEKAPNFFQTRAGAGGARLGPQGVPWR